jgi:hypothetical protein
VEDNTWRKRMQKYGNYLNVCICFGDTAGTRKLRITNSSWIFGGVMECVVL